MLCIKVMLQTTSLRTFIFQKWDDSQHSNHQNNTLWEIICLLFCHLLLQMRKKNTRTLSKTYSTFSLYSFLVMQKIITSHCVRKIKIPENKSFERTLNHRFFICIPEHMPINLALFYHTSWEIGWFTRRVKNRILLQSLKWNINYFMEGMEIKVNL